MTIIYSSKKTLSLFVFIIRSSGNSISPLRLLLILYNADKHHLKQYGRMITNDTYIATQHHSVGINALYLMLSIQGAINTNNNEALKKITFLKNSSRLTASSDYDVSYISKNEASSIFHIIRELKDISTQVLLEKSQDYAWENASCLSDIFQIDIAISAGADDSIIGYTYDTLDNLFYCNENN